MNDPIFEQLLDEQRQRKSALAGALTVSVGTNPDAFATQKRVAGYLGYPVAAVEAMPDLAEQAKVRRVQDDTAKAPMLAQRYTSADFAKLAHDDSGILATIETGIARAARYAMGATPSGGFIGTVKAFPDRAVQGIAGVKAMGADIVEPWARMVSGDGNQVARMSAYYKGLAKQAEARGDALDPPDDSVVGGGLSGGVNSMLQSSKYLPMALAGGPVGAAVALGGMVSETIGQSYLKADAKGLPLMAKLGYAVSDGVIEYATEKGPLGALVHSIKAGTPLGKAILQNAWKENKGEQIATVLQDLNEWAALNPEKPFTDYLAERPEAAAKTAIGVMVGAGGNTALMHSLQRSADMIAGRDRQAEYSTAQAAMMQDAMQAALQSKLRERSPDEFRAAVQAMADGTDGAPRSVFIDAEQLNQLPQEALQALPGEILAKMQTALASNDVVEIPIGDVLAIAPGTPFEQLVIEHGRMGDPMAASQFETKQAGEQAQQWLEQNSAAVIQQAQDSQAMQDSSDAVSKTIYDQLQAVGRWRSAVNDGYATWVAAFYTTMAGRMGMTPEEMHAKYPLRIVGKTGAGEVMDQDQPDYQGDHRPPGAENGAPLHDLTGGGNIYPDDVYGSMAARYYGTGNEALDRETMIILHGLKGKPSATVTVYRAIPSEATAAEQIALLDAQKKKFMARGVVPAGESAAGWYDRTNAEMSRLKALPETPAKAAKAINAGDWVTVNKAYAKEHGEGALNGNYKIISKKVKASEVFTNGDSIQEAGYWPAGAQTLNQSAIPQSIPQTETAAFKAWFGDSKVVDEQGKPLVVYHGTASDITTFRTTRTGEFGPAIYTTSDPNEATQYGAGQGGGLLVPVNVMPLYVSLQNPFTNGVTAFWKRFASENQTDDQAVKRAIDAGFDGVIELRKDWRDKTFTHYIAFKPEQIKSAIGNSGAFDPNDQSILNQSAYHGTPHAVDRFSLHKIGSGEGAQAFGWGLYFAGKKKVAEHYRKTLSDDVSVVGAVRVDGQKIEAFSPEGHAARLLFYNDQKQMRALAKEMLKDAAKGEPYAVDTAKKLGLSAADYYGRLNAFIATHTRKNVEVIKGNLYKVELPDDSDLMDYDKSVGSQPASVKTKLKASGILTDWKDSRADFSLPQDVRPDRGGALYALLSHKFGGDQAAAEFLRGIGIQGMRYKAGQIAGVKGGGHNYVIWDEAAISDVQPLFQGGALGTFNPRTLELALNKDANLTTFFHETGHFFLEVMADLASQPNAPAEIVADMNVLLAWFGIKGDEEAGGQDTGGPLEQSEVIGRRFSSLKGSRPTDSYVEATPRQQAALDEIDNGPNSTDYELLPATESLNTAADAQFEDWEEEPRIRYVPIGMIGPLTGYNNGKDVERIRRLADAIKESNTFEPIFVGIDPNGEAFIMEGQHRARALQLLGVKHVPAQVIVSMEGTEAEYDVQRKADAVVSTDYKAAEGQAALFNQAGDSPAGDVPPPTIGRTPMETWRAMTLDQKRPYHERFAESIEQYIMEGKAPSTELQPLFRKFSAWVLNVYRSAKQFIDSRGGATEIQLSDEVRQVFDRMLASKEQIQQAEDVAGMMPNLDATAEAVEKLTARSMRDLAWTVRAVAKAVKVLQRDAAEARKEVEAEVIVEVDAMPEMRAKAALDALQISPDFTAAAGMWREARATALADIQAKLKDDLYAANPDAKGLQKGQLLAKNKRAMANQAEAAMIAWEQANPKPIKPENVTDADLAVVADSFEFADVDTMLTAIDAIGKRADLIEAITDQRMLEQHGDLIDPAAIQAAANQAVHNEARAKSLATELKAQAEMLNQRTDTGKVNAAGSKITVSAIEMAAKQFGAAIVARTPLKDLKAKARQHTAAERRAATAWQQATMAGDTAGAVKAKQDQVLNNAAAKAAMDAMGEARDIAEFFKRVTKDSNKKTVEKGRDPDVVNAARAVLAMYGVGAKGGKSAIEYMALIETNDPLTFAALQDSLRASIDNAQPLEALTMEQLQGLHEEIQSMWHLAKRTRQMEVQGKLIDIDDAADELATRMADIGVPLESPGTSSALTPADTRARWLQFAGSLLRRAEQWSEGMDGKYGGPFNRLVFGPVKSAADAYRADRVTYRKAYQALIDEVAPGLRKGLIEAPELGYTFGKGHNGIGHAELLHAVLHTGNESNKRKLLLGREWATKNDDGTLDTQRWDAFIDRMQRTGVLGRVHYDFAQGVWDLLERTKPLAQRAHRDVFGRYFAEVTADAFDTPFGQYRGGYVPAQADPRIVQDADLRNLAALERENMSFSFPTTSKGFTKGRVEYNRPLMLDLRTIGQHIDKVLLFSHMEAAGRDVTKLLERKAVSQPLGKIDPTVYSAMLTPWLHRSMKQIVETPIVGDGGISRVLSAARSRAGMALMFANVSNTLQQITGFAGAFAKLKADGMQSTMLKSAAMMIGGGPKAMAASVAAASPFMANRMANEIAAINAAVNDILLDPSLYERAQAWTMKHAYFLQTAMDNTMGPVIWTSAYNAALGKSMGQDDAVRYADSVIRQTQGSTLPEDVSRIETGPAYARVFTQFIGYFNMVANTNATALKQISQDVGLKRGAGKALLLVTLGMMVPIWVAEAIAQAMRGGPEDDDDDGWLDDWLAAVFGLGTIKGMFAMVPFVGQLANAGINRFNGNPADDKMSISPAVSLIEAGVGVPFDIYKAITDEANARTLVRDVASAVSIATGLPAVAIARPLGYLAGVQAGKIEPTGPADAARGLVTGTASPDSKVR